MLSSATSLQAAGLALVGLLAAAARDDGCVGPEATDGEAMVLRRGCHQCSWLKISIAPGKLWGRQRSALSGQQATNLEWKSIYRRSVWERASRRLAE